MAQVNIELSHDFNDFELNIHKKCDELFKDFEKKWESILIRFEGQFLNNGYIIADPQGIEISTSSFSIFDYLTSFNFSSYHFKASFGSFGISSNFIFFFLFWSNFY